MCGTEQSSTGQRTKGGEGLGQTGAGLGACDKEMPIRHQMEIKLMGGGVAE